MRLTVSLFALLALQSAQAEIPGICTVPYVVEKYRAVMDRARSAWKRMERYNDTILKEECCDGYRTETLQPLSCSPICDPPCEKSDCMAPDTCVCYPGHVMGNNSTSTCYDVCDSCVNGACHSNFDKECTCDNGYKRDDRFPHICDPICTPACVNALCTAPAVCECNEGYKSHPDKFLNHTCVPHCTKDCVFGTCSEPDICTCFKGYINDKDSPSICLPICSNTCENSDCFAPEKCMCRDEFELHPRDPYVCIPQTSANYSLNYCVLKIPRAVKYDTDSDCFLIKENISLSVPSNCSVIQSHRKKDLDGISCAQPDMCHQSNCFLNFWCSAKKINDSNEIHCYLEENFSRTDSADIDHIANATEWTDIVLVVNALQNSTGSTEMIVNVTKEWTLQPLTKAVCGQMRFTMEVSECELPIMANNHINSTFMFWMNVILISGLLLLVCAGLGGFLWARHRRLNDPLNYREDMIQGYYNNECYENHPGELVSDDDSDQYSDAPL